jgi:uncharacterized protein (TIGR00297 family)
VTSVQAWLPAAGLGAGAAAVAYWRRTLTVDGALAAGVIGCVVLRRGGLPAAAALLTFFGSSSALSRAGAGRKRAAPLAQAKGSRRDAWQVLANGGWATLSIALGPRRGGGGFVGALAAAGADTWATELGLLAKSPPRLITTWQPVAAGTSGGITPEGLAASIGGALSVGLAWCWLDDERRGLPTALVAGVLGSLVDSWLGATLQALYRCGRCNVLTEDAIHPRCGQPAVLLRGQRWATNDVINALATLVGAIAGAACWRAPFLNRFHTSRLRQVERLARTVDESARDI